MKYRYAFAGLCLAAALAGGIFLMKKRQPLSSSSPRETDFSKSQGPQNAPVQIIEYSDFQCPACQRAEETLRKILKSHPGKIYFVFHHFPLPGHRWSSIAHQAAECAAQSGKFWEFHDRLYDHQQIWSLSPNAVEFLLQYAAELGLDLEPFAACLTDREVGERVLADKKMGDRLKINSTPTFFINEERLVGPVDLEQKGDAIVRRILGKPPVSIPAPAQSER